MPSIIDLFRRARRSLKMILTFTFKNPNSILEGRAPRFDRVPSPQPPASHHDCLSLPCRHRPGDSPSRTRRCRYDRGRERRVRRRRVLWRLPAGGRVDRSVRAAHERSRRARVGAHRRTDQPQAGAPGLSTVEPDRAGDAERFRGARDAPRAPKPNREAHAGEACDARREESECLRRHPLPSRFL